MEFPKKLELIVEYDECGLWFVKSGTIRGLLVSAPDLDAALNQVTKSIRNLITAKRMADEAAQA